MKEDPWESLAQHVKLRQFRIQQDLRCPGFCRRLVQSEAHRLGEQEARRSSEAGEHAAQGRMGGQKGWDEIGDIAATSPRTFAWYWI